MGVAAVLPTKPLKMYFGRPEDESTKRMEVEEELPLPDIILCSALSASIQHAHRIKERKRHKATIQTKSREHLNQDPETLMEPLVTTMGDLDFREDMEMEDDRARESLEKKSVRKRTTSASEAASRLSELSKATISLRSSKRKVDDTPEGVINGIKEVVNKMFSL